MQVALFANARAVVGYHGAGFANTMFSTHGACVVEASTHSDLAGNGLWRTNAFMCLPWNPNLRWVVYRIPLAEMLSANVRTLFTLRRPLSLSLPPSLPLSGTTCTQHPEPSIMHLAPSSQHPAPSTQHPAPSTQHPAPSTYTHPHPLPCQNVEYPNTTKAATRSYDDHYIKALPWVPLRPAEMTALAAVTQSCLGPLERGARWTMPARVNESHRQTLSSGGVYVDRIDLHSLRYLARHGGGGGGSGGNASHRGGHGHGHDAAASEQAPETDDEVIDRHLRIGNNWAGA